MTKNVLEVAMERAKRLKYLQPFLHSPTEAQLVAMADEIQRLQSDYATLEAKRCREVEHGGKLVVEIERLRGVLQRLRDNPQGLPRYVADIVYAELAVSAVQQASNCATTLVTVAYDSTRGIHYVE